jgi:hypothetical protein
MYDMIKTGSWSQGQLTGDDLVELFVSKSVYHANYTKLFPKAKEYAELEKWLDGSKDAPSNFELFGVEKQLYTFKDLKTILETYELQGKRKKVGDGKVGVAKTSGKGKQRAN